jgi:DNA-binding IclR family transcriptional regulator
MNSSRGNTQVKARGDIESKTHSKTHSKTKGEAQGSAQGIQVIARAADILRVLKTDKEGMSLGQIANRVNLPRSTVQRIVNALITERLVVASASEGGLRLGPEIQSLAMAAKFDVAKSIRPIITELSIVTEETVDLAVLREQRLVFIDQVEGNHRLRTVSAVGEIFPLTDTANGKAVLALMEEAQASVLITEELAARTCLASSVTDVLNDIALVRERGYSLDCDEHTMGISAVGVAFADQAGLLYAISIPVPSQRFADKQQQLIDALLSAVRQAVDIAG